MFGRSFLLIIAYCFIISTVNSSQSCSPIRQCEVVPTLSVESMSYELNVENWNSEQSGLCPSSDSDVPQWLVSFKNSSQNSILMGEYCSFNGTFNTSDVCSMPSGDKLVFQNSIGSSFRGATGVLKFGFTSINSSYETSFTIKYATTGVYPDKSTVYFEELQSYVGLNWFIYSPETDPSLKIYHNEQLLSDSTMKLDPTKYQTHMDRSIKCVRTSSGDSTTYFSLFVISPTAALSSGKYVLVLDTYSATIYLEEHPSTLFSQSVTSFLYTPPSSDVPVSTSLAPSITATSSMATAAPSSSSSITIFSTVLIVPTPSSRSSLSKRLIYPVILPAVSLFLILAISTITAIALVIKCKLSRRRGTNSKDIEKSVESPQRQQQQNIYVQQLSQDPSLHKYHLTNDIRKKHGHNETMGLEEIHHQTDNTAEKHVAIPPTTTHSSSASSKSLGEQTADSSTRMKVEDERPFPHPKIAKLKRQDDGGTGTSHSLPSSPQLHSGSLSSSSPSSSPPAMLRTLVSLSQSQLHYTKENKLLLQKLHGEKKRDQELQQEIASATLDIRNQASQHSDLLLDISATVETHMVLDTTSLSAGGSVNRLATEDDGHSSIEEFLQNDLDQDDDASSMHSGTINESNSIYCVSTVTSLESSDEKFRNNSNSPLMRDHKH